MTTVTRVMGLAYDMFFQNHNNSVLTAMADDCW